MSAGGLESRLRELKTLPRMGLMTHVVLGYPTLDESVSLVRTMADAGVDLIEIQIPFSDPIADGATIMHASDVALRNGVVPDDGLRAVATLSAQIDTPLLLMGYYNTCFRYGVERFCRAAREAGAVGLIVPDIPLDEEAHEHFISHCEANDLHHIRIVSPASTPERLRRNGALANGFVYCISRYGTTGARQDLDPRMSAYLERVRHYVSTPLAVGFGISTPAQVHALQGHAEIAVVGSSVLELVRDRPAHAYLPDLDRYLRALLEPAGPAPPG